MASGPITSWEIDGEIVETVADFILGGSIITADSDCSHEIKMLAPWKQSYDQPTPVFLLVKLHGLNRVEGYSPWGRKESDMTELLHFHLTPWKESYDQPRQHIKKQRHYFVNKGPSSQGYGLSSSHVWM